MSFNGSGTFNLAAGNPVVTGTTISSTTHNNTNSDIATGLSTCITKDGQTTVTANIPFGGFRLTGIGVGSASTDAARVSQVQNGTNTLLGSVSGTNTVLAAASPTLTAYASGQKFVFVPANTNTGATTINIDSVGAKNVFSAGAACVGGELVASQPFQIEYDGTQFNILGQSVKQQATATVAAHATTSNVWVAREVVLSGGAVTFTDIADAPYAGAVVWVKQNAAHIWTDGATFNIQGGGNYTAAADDWIRIYATTVSTFEITVFKADGVPAGITTGSTASTFTFNGAGGTSGSVTLAWQKSGNYVTLHIPAVQATTGAGSTALTSNTALDVAVRPTTQQVFRQPTSRNNGGADSGAAAIFVNTNGTLIINRDGSANAYTDASSCGTQQASTLTYYLA